MGDHRSFGYVAEDLKPTVSSYPARRLGFQPESQPEMGRLERIQRNRKLGPYPAYPTTSQRRPLIFETSEAMSASANFLKLKICVTDFDNAIATKQRVAFCSNVN